MKKLMLAAALATGVFATANAGECIWSWWVGAPAENSKKDVNGAALGIASETASITGAQVSLLWNKTEKVKSGAQVTIGYNEAKKVKNGPQVGLVNVSDSAALQFGLLCFNKGGFLPFFPFFNFDKTAFGGANK